MGSLFKLYVFNLYKDNTSDSNYNDYKLAEALGITPQRVVNLKTNMSLRFPSEYQWEEAFVEAAKKAEPVGDKIGIYIHDIRLYNELKKQIDALGSYSESTLTKQYLTISYPCYVDLYMSALGDADKQKVKNEIINQLKAADKDNNQLNDLLTQEDPSIKSLMRNGANVLKPCLGKVVELIPAIGPILAPAVEPVLDLFINKCIGKSNS